MSKKLISITLVLMIIFTTAVVTYALDQTLDSNDFIAAESSEILGQAIPDGIGYKPETPSSQVPSNTNSNEVAKTPVNIGYNPTPDGIGFTLTSGVVPSIEGQQSKVPNAGKQISVEYFDREIVVNGVTIANYQSDYPYFTYNEIVYVPISWENCNIFGYKKDVDNNHNVLLTKTAPTQSNYLEQTVQSTEIMAPATISGKTVTVRKTAANGSYDDTLLTTEVTQGYPILEYNSVIYIPLTHNVTANVLGWSKEYDEYSGLYLNTTGTNLGSSMINSKTSAYNKALVNYIRKINPNVVESEALELVFLVKQKARIYGIDERLVLAMIQKESTFYEDVEGAGGAVGLMQIMPTTGKILGATGEQLQIPSINVDLGTKHIAQQINTYGSIDAALVAYNAGGNAVQNGKTSSSYSDTVISYYKNIMNATAV